jgi:hypothetical protein
MLMATARTSQQSLADSMRTSAEPGIDAAVHAETMAEVERGWLVGPFSQAEVTRRLGKIWTAARRFGILQGGKLRCIDDYSEFQINAAFGSSEKIDCGGVDEILVAARSLIKALAKPDVVVELSSGSTLRGTRHEEWGFVRMRRLVGRLLDLKGAYKQLARRASQKWVTVIGVWNPALAATEFYEQPTLAFGQCGAVHGFNRAAKALRKIAVVAVKVVTTNFYDDYSQVEATTMGLSAQTTLEGLMELLGWSIADSERKRRAFAELFEPLGVVMDFTASELGVVAITNKPGRVEDVMADITACRQSRKLDPQTAASIRGRILYLEQQCMGRCGAMATKALGVRARGGGTGWDIGPELTRVLTWLQRYFATVPQRVVSFGEAERPVVLLTDGAFEDETATCGGVIIDGTRREMFGVTLPESITRAWLAGRGFKQCIGQVELIPMWICRELWPALLRRRRVLWFIDNDSARFALIGMYSPSQASTEILEAIATQELALQTLSWCARVASLANIGDGPSRLKFDEAAELGFVRICADSALDKCVSLFGTKFEHAYVCIYIGLGLWVLVFIKILV